MNRRLRIKIREYNNRNHNSKRIIIGKLKPNCDKSLNKHNNKGLMSQIKTTWIENLSIYGIDKLSIGEIL